MLDAGRIGVVGHSLGGAAALALKRNLLFAQQQATREANAAPLIFEIRFKRLEAAQATSRNASGWVRVDAYTVRRTLTSILDYF
jgi:predicted dienelactone hydrolase